MALLWNKLDTENEVAPNALIGNNGRGQDGIILPSWLAWKALSDLGQGISVCATHSHVPLHCILLGLSLNLCLIQ